MLVQKQQKNPSNEASLRKRYQVDFTKIGGLSNNLKVLNDMVIFPLLHKNVYTHFNIKIPRGILFYGPPGTGKTLLANALGAELNKAGMGKVSFFHRKGADILDKWVGETEKKLKKIFESATKARPSIIFFDEIDGLVPARSAKQDHIHCSIVTTLLSLMDGLDSIPGVIVIGATNRIDSIDPALRRAGRFDRELYFPPPSIEGRKEILRVHTESWKHKPSPQTIDKLAELTSGFCGADLVALCTEAVLCCMKRCHPNAFNATKKLTKIQLDDTEIEECDFLNARKSIIPTFLKMGDKMRKLDPIVQPLLQQQLKRIVDDVRAVWPHFFQRFYQYLVGEERYAGRVLLYGTTTQGINNHLIPAILINFEHLPQYTIEAATLLEKTIPNFMKSNPCILIINSVDELWEYIDNDNQIFLMQMLENIFSSLPILVIASCSSNLPPMLRNFFFNNTTVIKKIKCPTKQEIEEFFAPLFFGKTNSLQTFLSLKMAERDEPNERPHHHQKQSSSTKFKTGRIDRKKSKMGITANKIYNAVQNSDKNYTLHECPPRSSATNDEKPNSVTRFSLMLSNLLKRKHLFAPPESSALKYDFIESNYGNSNDPNKKRLYNIWKRTIRAGIQMEVAKLEMTYDAIAASMNFSKDRKFDDLTNNIEKILEDIEVSQNVHHK